MTLRIRIQKYREKLADYNFEVSWIAVKTLLVADAFSRALAFFSGEEDVNKSLPKPSWQGIWFCLKQTFSRTWIATHELKDGHAIKGKGEGFKSSSYSTKWKRPCCKTALLLAKDESEDQSTH